MTEVAIPATPANVSDHAANNFAQKCLYRLFPAHPVPETRVTKRSAWKNPIGWLYFSSAFHVVRVSDFPTT